MARHRDRDYCVVWVGAVNHEWQPAIIAPRKYVEAHHSGRDEGRVSCFAGERIKVRELDESYREMSYVMLNYGCKGRPLEVHPDDAQRLWPSCSDLTMICDCRVLVD